MDNDATDSAEPNTLNPYYAKVIGFVDEAGLLIDSPDPSKNYNNLLINAGEDDEVKVGERVLVFGLGPEILDPDTGDSLGAFEIVRGHGRVTSTQTKMSIIHSTRTVRVLYQPPIRAQDVLSGVRPEQAEKDTPAPFKSAKLGDYVRFI